MWTQKKLEALRKSGKIRDFKYSERKSAAIETRRGSKEKEWLSWNLTYWCNEKCVELVTEYKFHEERKWRFDFAIPAFKIGIEYEGLMSQKSRHTTVTGFTGDANKYNTAQAAGWKVLRFTVINYKTVLQQLEKIINANA